MKDIGYGQGYDYDHDVEEGFSGDNYWPEEMTAETFYRPAGRFLRGERERDPRPSRPQRRRQDQIGRARVLTPGTNSHLVCSLLLAKKNHTNTRAKTKHS